MFLNFSLLLGDAQSFNLNGSTLFPCKNWIINSFLFFFKFPSEVDVWADRLRSIVLAEPQGGHQPLLRVQATEKDPVQAWAPHFVLQHLRRHNGQWKVGAQTGSDSTWHRRDVFPSNLQLVSCRFLMDLEQRLGQSVLISQIGDVVLGHCPQFRSLYVPYVTNMMYQEALVNQLLLVLSCCIYGSLHKLF